MASRTRARLVLIVVVVLTFLACGAARRRLAPAPGEGGGGVPATVVCLAPSLTETVFALGAGERVVGVTRYCTYPPEVCSRPEVGGYFDPNYEAILRLHPDLVLTLEEHVDVRERLAAAGVNVFAVNHKTIDGILDSITALGDVLALPDAARRLADELAARVDAVRRAGEGQPRPRVLIVVDRAVGSGLPGKMYICGRDTFFDPMIRWAGGENAYQGPAIAYPVVTPEGLLSMDPEVIIDLVPANTRPETLLAARADWDALPSLRALSTDRVHVWNEDYTMVPGPRFILALERLAEVLHPAAPSAMERTSGTRPRQASPSNRVPMEDLGRRTQPRVGQAFLPDLFSVLMENPS